MKPGIILALSASLILVGGATWTRFSSPATQQNLVVVDQNEKDSASYQEFFANLVTASTTTASEEPMTGTDLVARQLMLDYMDLANTGQATEYNLLTLADRYVDSIPTLNYAVKISFGDLNIVKSTPTNIKIYSDELGRIYQKYAGDVTNASTGGEVDEDLTNSHYSFLKKAGESYQKQAMELKNMSVPEVLASAHLRLVNINLASASSLKAASETKADPATGFAGLISMSQNMDDEMVIVKEIGAILKANGI